MTRLIRISYGPFQLGELAEGACAGDEGPPAARPARRAADRGVRRQFRGAGGGPVLQQAGARRARAAAELAERPKIVRDGVQGRIGEGGLIKGRRRDRDGERTQRAVEADHAARRAIVVQEGAGVQEGVRAQDGIRAKARFRKDDGFKKARQGEFRTARLQGQAGRRQEPTEGQDVERLDGARRQAPGQEGFRGWRALPRPASGRERQAAAAGRARARAVRIVGGEFRGRPLATPRSDAIRPTTDRTREALFNILAHRFADRLDGARVLDLFAGTGALGLEALSRGASFCLFIEESAEGRGLIRDNVENFRADRAQQDFPARRDRARRSRHDGSRSACCLPIRPMARASANGRCARRRRAAGCCRARSASSRRPRPRASIPAQAFSVIDERGYGDTVIRIIGVRLTSAPFARPTCRQMTKNSLGGGACSPIRLVQQLNPRSTNQ